MALSSIYLYRYLMSIVHSFMYFLAIFTFYSILYNPPYLIYLYYSFILDSNSTNFKHLYNNKLSYLK